MNMKSPVLKMVAYIGTSLSLVLFFGCSTNHGGSTIKPDLAVTLPGTYETDNRAIILSISPDLTAKYSMTIMGSTTSFTGNIKILSEDSFEYDTTNFLVTSPVPYKVID